MLIGTLFVIIKCAFNHVFVVGRNILIAQSHTKKTLKSIISIF